MRLVLVHDWLTGMRGGEKCLEVLCRRFPQARLLTLLHVPGSTSPAIERMPITTSPLQRLPGVGRIYRWLLPLMPRAVERLSMPRDVDLVVSFSHAVAKSVLPPPGVPHVCYCFTPMRYAWHLRDEYFGRPEEASGRVFSARLAGATLGKARNLVLDRLRDWDRTTSDRVTHYVAISQTVAERIRECYGRESTVIYPPVDTEFYTPAAVPREDFYLCVSALAPYKRIDLAISACNRLGRRLVVIGNGPQRRRLAALAGPTVQLLGWRSNEEIRGHLRRCRALVFPGLEDFGIVPLEAQACGTPVIAFGQGGATETILPPEGGRCGSGLFFDEPSVEALCQAMETLEQHPSRFCPQVARQQAERFSAERYEREILAFLEQAACRQPSAARIG
jgi:glycosyltransferase involved in cell wall biosynthesis